MHDKSVVRQISMKNRLRIFIIFLILVPPTIYISYALVPQLSSVDALTRVPESDTTLKKDMFYQYFHPSTNGDLIYERINHPCNVKLPSEAELEQRPYSLWSVSRFVAYYNIYKYLQQKWSVFAPTKKAEILDVGGSAFLVPFKNIVNITLTTHPGVDIHDTPFPSNHFDAVATDQVFEHLISPHVAIMEIHRILKPGGLAIITTVAYNPMHENGALTNFHDMWRFMPDGLRILSVPFEGGIQVCGAWGTKHYVNTRNSYGIYSEQEKEIFLKDRKKLLTHNDKKNIALVWIVIEK